VNVYEFCGSARDIGRQQGEAFAEGIAFYVETYCRFPSLSPARKETMARELLNNVERFCPRLAEEIRGMAEGAHLSLVDLCTYNFQNFFAFLPGGAQCSNVMFPTSDRGPLLGKNADLGEDAPRYTALLRKRYSDGLTLVGYSYRGNVGMQGVSNWGLATGGSSVTVKEAPAPPEGFPDSVVSAALLHNCKTVAEAVELLLHVPYFGKGANFALADAGGEVAVVETTRTHRQVVPPNNREALVCTNLLVSGAREPATPAAYVANAEARYRILHELIDQAGELTVDLMCSLLRHRAETGVSICQRDEELNMHSRPSYVALPGERAILMTDDYPDRSEFEEVAV